MKIKVIYKDASEYGREVTDFLRDFQRQTGHELETVDPDTPDGTMVCRAYDIVEYPTIIAISEDGVMQQMWRGRPLPTINEVSYYA